MRARLALLVLAGATCGFAQSNFVWDTVTGAETYYHLGWVVNGDLTFGTSGSVIWPATVSGTNSNDYEIDTLLDLNSGGGTYIHFLRAATTSVMPGSGSYISVEYAVPSGWATGGAVPVAINQWVNGTVTQLAGTSVSLHNGDTVRSVVWGTTLWIFVNNLQYGTFTIPLTTGQPGYGGYSVPSGSGISQNVDGVKLGHHDTVAPNALVESTVDTSLLPYSASFRWQGVADDPVGIGVFQYVISRGGTQLASIDGADFTDATVQPSTTYTYSIAAVDYHGNIGSAATLTLTTPPRGAVDPRRTGVYSTGSYWGGGGEQIDTLSGNLNFMLPLLTAQGRTGWKVPVNLTYNSQNWRQDNGVNWQLGSDVGFGFGWKALIGSITPYYTSSWTGVDHYVYTDNTGAEYRLDQDNNGIWTSLQGIYIWFDQNANKLHFKDGTFWAMGSTSGGTEADAGTMYPTVIEDVNGNQVLVTYATGAGVGVTDTSARIQIIEDARAGSANSLTGPLGCPNSGISCYRSYYFTYNTDAPVPHLTGLYNYIGTAEMFTLSYATSSLSPPFGSDPNFAGLSTTHLASMEASYSYGSTNQPPMLNPYLMTYDTAGAGELLEVAFPFGGHLRWTYANDTYTGSRTLRAVSGRYVATDSAGANEWSYGITRDNASSAILHATMSLTDASGNGSKTWNFTTSSSSPWQLGLVSEFVEKPSLGSSSIYEDDTYTWSQDPAGHPYISAKSSVIDEGAPNQQSALTTQTLDQYGNATQAAIYPYNNTTSAVKTYNSTYLSSTGYAANYIFDRLTQTTLLTSSGTKTLVQNVIDGVPFGSWGYFGHCGSTASPVVPNGYQPPTREMDPNPSIPFASRGLIDASTTPAVLSCQEFYSYGGFAIGDRSDGQSVRASADSATNYAAPQTVTTQSYNTSVAYNSWLGITSTTGANGEQLSISYDSIGRPIAGYSPYNTNGVPNDTWSYSLAPSVSSPLTPVLPVQQMKTGTDGFTRTTLDGMGRAILVERGTDVNHIQSQVSTVYAPCACSPLGKIQQVSQPYAPGGTPVWTVYTYDGIGRTLSVTQPDGASATTYAYSGNQTTVTDPAGKSKQFTNDVEKNLLSVVEPDPCITGNTLTTSYTYDWMNHVSGVTMTRPNFSYASNGVCSEIGSPVTQTRTFVYSDAGLLTSATNPETQYGTVYYYYNADNTLFYKHDAKGQDTVYTYDSEKRVTEIQRYPTGKNNTEDYCQRVTYSYDTNPYLSGFSYYSTGRLTAVQYSASCAMNDTYTEMYSYHPAGGVTAKQLMFQRSANSPLSLQVNYSYNNAGQVATVSYPMMFTDSNSNQPTLTYSYDSMGRPSALKDTVGDIEGSTTWASNVQYDFAGRLTSLQTGPSFNYVTRAMTYNPSGQIATVNWTPLYGSTTGVQYSYSTTQNNGQITQAVDSLSGETISYQYDALKRLTSASSTPNSGSTPTAWTQTFQYDGFGNLTAKVLNGTSTSIGVNSSTNQLTNAYYDLNGNMTSGAGATLTYDEANRVATAQTLSGSYERYGYSPDNKQVYRYVNNESEYLTFYGAHGEKLGTFLYNGENYLGPILQGVATSVWFAGQLAWESTLTSGNDGLVALDRLGTNRMSPAYPYAVARYYPYGDEITSTSNDRTKFATYIRDSITGLDYADQRYYASTYGRFNTPDPYVASARLKDPSRSWNRYAYTRGDPVNRLDPRGLDDCAQDESWCGNDPCDPSSYYYDPYDPSCDDGGDDDDGSFGETYFAPPTSFTPVTRGSGGGAGGAHPSPPTPTCSISLYERPVNVAGLSTTAVHTYIDATVTYDGVTQQDIIDGGPIAGLRASGLLLNGWSTVGATGHYASDNPSLLSNDEIGSTYTGLSACQDISQLNSEVSSYDKGTLAMYNPVPSFWVPGWNSNSFTYTLLNSVGLAFSFGNLPSWTPGWGLAVPGLTSPY